MKSSSIAIARHSSARLYSISGRRYWPWKEKDTFATGVKGPLVMVPDFDDDGFYDYGAGDFYDDDDDDWTDEEHDRSPRSAGMFGGGRRPNEKPTGWKEQLTALDSTPARYSSGPAGSGRRRAGLFM